MIARYMLFAVLATIVNIVFQSISFFFYSQFLAIYIAMFIGTLAGLVFKYILDKKYIFFHTPKNNIDDGKKFLFYSLMGIFTTFIFWGFELWFDHLMENEAGKYIGAIVGLTIGYIVKYFLDKKFVFKD